MQIPEYIELKTSGGSRVAYISPQADKLRNCFIENEQNGSCVLTFELPVTSKKWTYITDGHRLYAGGKEFVIHGADSIEMKKEGHRKWGVVKAQESWVLLRKKHRTVSNDPSIPTPAWSQVVIVSGGAASGGFAPGSAGSALSYLLQSSGWTVGTVDVSGTYDLETEKENLLTNIKKVQQTWGGIFVWDSINKIVHLRSESTWQPYNGFQIRYAKNLKHITRTDDYDIVTRLYPFGLDDINISSVNAGMIYLENFSYTTDVYEDIYRNQELTTAQQVKNKGQEILVKVCKPRHNYRTTLVDLSTLPEYSHETFTVSDLVDIIDEDLGSVQVRVIKHKYKVFQPWICELEIGDPLMTIEAIIADASKAASYVNMARANNGFNNLIKGIIDTFSTDINGAKGSFDVVDGVSTWREKDGNGNFTGKIVRISPGGIAVSRNGGVDWDIILTANGIVAKQFFAIASNDGFTKLIDSGLVVYDSLAALRVHLGQHTTGKFGLKLIDPNGSQTILDDQGILQSWQDGRTDNVDGTHPLILNVYLPAETRTIKKALLRFRLLKFRAYETAAASGGGSTSGASSSSTTLAGGGSTSGGGSWFTESGYTSGMNATNNESDHTHQYTFGGHGHTEHDGYSTSIAQAGVTITTTPAGGHGHTMTLNHNHTVYSHFHGMDHTHSTPNHTHGLNFGIYEGTEALGVTVKINGIDRTSTLGGGTGFNMHQDALNIASYLVSGAWNTIELGSTQLGRIDATVFVQAMMGV